jgi:hypothetical protein
MSILYHLHECQGLDGILCNPSVAWNQSKMQKVVRLFFDKYLMIRREEEANQVAACQNKIMHQNLLSI